MDASNPVPEPPSLGTSARRMAHRLLAICENRFQLLMVEAQEERDCLLNAFWMSLLAATFSLLAGVTITLVVAVAFWNYHPIAALLVVAIIYAGVAIYFCNKLMRLKEDWQTLPDTLNQLKKDKECLASQTN